MIATDFGKKQSSNSFVAKISKRSSLTKKDLHIINLTNIDLPEETKLFINGSLCPHYESLWVNCKNMKNRKRIHSFFTANSILKCCFKEHGPVNVVTYKQDLKDLFPNVGLSHYMLHL